jgi:SAM-dependent methyltransferase
VLDACAGSGASALPAAERVGPTGKVIAVDLADNLLALARAKADRLGIAQLETRHGDIEALEYPPGAFDAVIIVFGVFFLPDMAAATAALWQLVRPGGQLAVTTWEPRLWEPANSVFWDAVVAAWHPLGSPEDFWTIVRGSGYRATHDAMSVDEREAVRARCLAVIAERRITTIETNVVYAQATKPYDRRT